MKEWETEKLASEEDVEREEERKRKQEKVVDEVSLYMVSFRSSTSTSTYIYKRVCDDGHKRESSGCKLRQIVAICRR